MSYLNPSSPFQKKPIFFEENESILNTQKKRKFDEIEHRNRIQTVANNIDVHIPQGQYSESNINKKMKVNTFPVLIFPKNFFTKSPSAPSALTPIAPERMEEGPIPPLEDLMKKFLFKQQLAESEVVALPYSKGSFAEPAKQVNTQPSNSKKKSKGEQLPRYWSNEEHQLFLEGLELYGPKDFKAISEHVGTRTATQVRTHNQKYILKLQREEQQQQKIQNIYQRQQKLRLNVVGPWSNKI